VQHHLDPAWPGRLWLDPVVLVADQPREPGAGPHPAPANSHDDGATTTPGAWVGLHSYWAPSRRLSGSFSGGHRQSVVTSEGSVFQAGSSGADQGL
jgi:hypothetical protein